MTLSGGCSNDSGDSLQDIQASGRLVVVTRNNPTTYYLDKSGPTGFEYVLASMLAAELKVELAMRPTYSLDDIFVQLQQQDVDLAAAGLTLTQSRQDNYPHSAVVYQQSPQVIYVAGKNRPRNIADLVGRDILVLAGSSHAQSLQGLQAEGMNTLQWREVEVADSMELLEMINTGQGELALVDSNEFEAQQSLYPRLNVGFNLDSEQDMVWFLPPHKDHKRLLATIDSFLQRLRDDGTLSSLKDKYFGQSTGVSRMGSHTFNRNMRQKLPDFRPLIEQVAHEYQMDWHLLAAAAYQESHWNPTATSPTGVRGMMMLTLPTARELGVDDRLDATQSLRGGARYLKQIKRRLPQDIYEPDRTFLALAAYNIGMGHLEDARVITERNGGDPHLWDDIMENLPLLQKAKYYQRARYGYARGQEAVTYVQNIRHYNNILRWQDLAENQPTPPVTANDYLPETVRNSNLSAL